MCSGLLKIHVNKVQVKPYTCSLRDEDDAHQDTHEGGVQTEAQHPPSVSKWWMKQVHDIYDF